MAQVTSNKASTKLHLMPAIHCLARLQHLPVHAAILPILVPLLLPLLPTLLPPPPLRTSPQRDTVHDIACLELVSVVLAVWECGL